MIEGGYPQDIVVLVASQVMHSLPVDKDQGRRSESRWQPCSAEISRFSNIKYPHMHRVFDSVGPGSD
jgi:hypothetical protein